MKLETAELLTNYMGKIEPDYSGRGMYGETTAAVTFDSEKDFYKCLSDIITDAVADQNMNDAELLKELLINIKTDNMGMGIIIY